MSNVKLGQSYEVNADQSGVADGYIRLASGMVIPVDEEGRAIIKTEEFTLPPVIEHLESSDAEGNVTTKEVKARDTVTGKIVAKYVVSFDKEGNVTNESKEGDVSLLGLESDFPLGTIVIGVGAVLGAYLLFKG